MMLATVLSLQRGYWNREGGLKQTIVDEVKGTQMVQASSCNLSSDKFYM